MSDTYIGNTRSATAGNRRRRGNVKCSGPVKCRCTDNQLIRLTDVADVYRTVLGPTTDETILAGLQTVMDMCLSPSRQADQSQSEYSSETNYTASDSEAVSRLTFSNSIGI